VAPLEESQLAVALPAVAGHRWQHQISQLLSGHDVDVGAHGIGVEGRSGQQSSPAVSLDSEPPLLLPESQSLLSIGKAPEARSSSSMPPIMVGGWMDGGMYTSLRRSSTSSSVHSRLGAGLSSSSSSSSEELESN
jgi:hypothetical protein